jgi:hypothetical protein
MKFVVDTNVPVVANQRQTSPVSPICTLTCALKIREIETHHILILDNRWLILQEYMANLRSKGQPGVGDAFLKWVLTNWANPQHCELVPITPQHDYPEPQMFEEFPHEDENLIHFDPSDRKFVAVALVHPEHPPILNAVDTDWRDYQQPLAKYGVEIDFLCPAEMARHRQ